MFITQIYKYKKDDIVYVGGNVPEDAEILETMNILNAEERYVLQRKEDGEIIGSSIWLKDGDSQLNYIEVEEPQPEPEPEPEEAETENE